MKGEAKGWEDRDDPDLIDPLVEEMLEYRWPMEKGINDDRMRGRINMFKNYIANKLERKLWKEAVEDDLPRPETNPRSRQGIRIQVLEQKRKPATDGDDDGSSSTKENKEAHKSTSGSPCAKKFKFEPQATQQLPAEVPPVAESSVKTFAQLSQMKIGDLRKRNASLTCARLDGFTVKYVEDLGSERLAAIWDNKEFVDVIL